jgi:hypothetical protein
MYKIRPISVGEIWYRLFTKLVVSKTKAEAILKLLTSAEFSFVPELVLGQKGQYMQLMLYLRSCGRTTRRIKEGGNFGSSSSWMRTIHLIC